VLIEQFDATPNRYYILTELRRAGEGGEAGAELEIARKVWFDRADLSIVRIQLYGPGGRLDSDISYLEWPTQEAAPAGAASGTQQSGTSATLDFARDIRITRPQDDYQLEIHITKLALNQPIAPDKFVLQQPPSSELVHVGEESGGGAQP
jgi:outer membrane lipoprotein-sorting protein